MAILGVIITHTSQSVPSQISLIDSLSEFGRFGVQLFYYISALTMCYMWTFRQGEMNPIRNFYIRRFFRIAPLFWLAIPTYLIMNGFEPNYWAPDGIGTLQILLTATFLNGFWPDSINSVVPGGWSIAVEMTFYVLFPFLITKLKDKKIYTYYQLTSFGLLIFLYLKTSQQTFFLQTTTTITQHY